MHLDAVHVSIVVLSIHCLVLDRTYGLTHSLQLENEVHKVQVEGHNEQILLMLLV